MKKDKVKILFGPDWKLIIWREIYLDLEDTPIMDPDTEEYIYPKIQFSQGEISHRHKDCLWYKVKRRGTGMVLYCAACHKSPPSDICAAFELVGRGKVERSEKEDAREKS